MVEQGDKILLIDKHAAHERANFDKLKGADYKPMVQELLSPVTLTLPPEERALLLEQLELLARFGFEVERFGGNALHTMACKAAIKGGWRNGAEELEEAARLVMSGAVKYCPHGRPVAIELTKKQLEKQFRRG